MNTLSKSSINEETSAINNDEFSIPPHDMGTGLFMVKAAFIMYTTGGGEKGLWRGGGGVLKFFEGKIGMERRGNAIFLDSACIERLSICNIINKQLHKYRVAYFLV